jgi:hypothetical protein
MEALQRLHNRGSISTGYDIDNSVKLEADNTEYFSRTPSSATNRQTFTFSTWIKRTELGQNARVIDVHSNGQNFTTFGFDTSDRIVLYAIDGGVDYGGHYTKRFRDTSAWYHIVWKSDITNSTAANRWQIYVNGVEVTGKDTDYGTPPTNFYTLIDTATAHKIGYNTDGSNGSSQYMAETHFVDGTALAPTAFGEYDDDSGIWKPIQVSGVTYGTNGFYLDYADASDLGDDESGNGNDWTENNITAADQATDTPTNNFCTYNAIMYMFGNTYVTEGATKTAKSYQNWITPMPTMGVSKGKWYAEFEFVNTGIDSMVGVVPMGEAGYEGSGVTNSNAYLGQSTNSIGYYGQQGNKYTNGSGSSYGNSYAAGDKMAVALDMDNGKVYFAKNGTWQNSGDPTSGSTGTGAIDLIQPSETHGIASSIWANNGACLANYGGFTTISISSAASDADGYGTFEYAPPSGYYALCTKNLEEYG